MVKKDRTINIGTGNYNENIEGDYIQVSQHSDGVANQELFTNVTVGGDVKLGNITQVQQVSSNAKVARTISISNNAVVNASGAGSFNIGDQTGVVANTVIINDDVVYTDLETEAQNENLDNITYHVDYLYEVIDEFLNHPKFYPLDTRASIVSTASSIFEEITEFDNSVPPYNFNTIDKDILKARLMPRIFGTKVYEQDDQAILQMCNLLLQFLYQTF